MVVVSVLIWFIIILMFLYGSWMYFIFNMWSLWLFGDNVEDRVGYFRFLIFYILSGIVVVLIYWFFNVNLFILIVGVLGVILGVMGVYFLMFLFLRIVILILFGFIFIFIEILVIFFFGIWFLL